MPSARFCVVYSKVSKNFSADVIQRAMLRDRRKILAFRMKRSPSRALLILTAISALIHFAAIAFIFERGQPVLFYLLLISEIFHVWLALTYLHTVWGFARRLRPDPTFRPPVDIYITVAGEPMEVVARTVRAAKALNYPHFRVHILNDGYVAGKPNWAEAERLAARLKVNCITRTVPGGAKAGNINHALSVTPAEYIAVFDADHAPLPDFLNKTMDYFADGRMAFVQTPQFYRNRDESYLTAGAWEQQELFFGPICRGKNRTNSVFMCGTNMVIRKAALREVGGMAEDNIAEDFVTSLFIHERGWKSAYVPEVLAEGLAPEDLFSYYKQQFRWARGSLEIVFRFNPLFRSGLTWSQRIEYLASASYHLAGSVVLLNALFPIIFFLTGQVPFDISTMALAAVFLPYIFLMIYTLQRTSNFGYTFRALALSMSLFPIQLQALWAVLRRKPSVFAVTSKTKLTGNFLYLALPHLIYFGLVFAGLGIGLGREGLSASLLNNSAWALFNVAVFAPFALAAIPSFEAHPREEESFKTVAFPPPRYEPSFEPVRKTNFPQKNITYFRHHEHQDDN